MVECYLRKSHFFLWKLKDNGCLNAHMSSIFLSISWATKCVKGRLAETNNYINYINYMLKVKKRVQKAYSKHHFCVKHIHIVYSNVIQLYIIIL